MKLSHILKTCSAMGIAAILSIGTANAMNPAPSMGVDVHQIAGHTSEYPAADFASENGTLPTDWYPQGESSIGNLIPGNKEVLVNIPLTFFDAKMAGNNLPGIKYFRTFGVDFKKPKVDGLYQYVDDRIVDEFIEYTNAHNKEVIWTLYVTSRTLDTELAYVKDLMKRGMNITAFEYGGEFYLPKYARVDKSKKGVVEKVTPEIYVNMMKDWLPAFMEVLPLSKGDHIIIGASHDNSGSRSAQHRQQWNQNVVRMMKANFPDLMNQLSWSFHIYGGREASTSPKGEEEVFDKVDFSFMKDFPSEMKIFVTESGYNITAFTSSELRKAKAFWTAVYQALRPGDVYGIHILINKGKKPNQYALIDRTGALTPVGKAFKEWIANRNSASGYLESPVDNDGSESPATNDASGSKGTTNPPTLVGIDNTTTLFSHVQQLSFSDGTTAKASSCRLFGKPEYSSSDIGRPKHYFVN